MKPIARGELAPYNGVVLTQEEHEEYLKLKETLPSGRLISKDCWEEVILPALRIVNALHEESLASKGIEHHEPQEKPIKVVS